MRQRLWRIVAILFEALSDSTGGASVWCWRKSQRYET
jgi:hypothetical protein